LVVGGLYASSLYGGWRSRALQNISLIIWAYLVLFCDGQIERRNQYILF
jgi:hypothetical protein